MTGETAGQQIPELAGLQRRFLIAAGVLGAAAIAGWLLNPAQFYQSYLLGYMLVLGATLGCLGLGMIHQLSGGGWGVLVRRPIGAATRIMPVLTILFVPIVAGMHDLYEWTHEDVVAADEALRFKQPYLNVPFFLARAALYFVVWNAVTFFLNAWALEQDRTGDPRLSRRMQVLSGGGLAAYALTVTFASFDWMMSLAPHWFSTIYGVLIMGGQGLTALAFLIVVLIWLGRRPPLQGIVGPDHLHDLANLMLAFVLLWAYFAFSQYLIIWSGNLPEEIEWYLHRLQPGWRAVAATLMIFHFAVPFVLLLSRAVKREPRTLLRVAAAILLVRFVDLFWLIAPEFREHGLAISWQDIVVPLALVALWLGCFMSQLRRRAILPIHDPQFDELFGGLIEGVERPRTSH
jgi:hypothetical protein